MDRSKLVLVTGATGYIGGRLVPALLRAGYRVRALVRDARRLQGRPWTERVEVVEGDATRPETLVPAMAGVGTAYYLIHSLTDTEAYRERDKIVARDFGQVAHDAGVERIIYLGGLGDPEAELSVHLRSRQEVGAALSEAGVPVTEFRAAIIVGSGSLSFEMIRYLTERLPVMITPKWLRTRIQPIAIRDVLRYLVDALQVPESAGRIIEIGGADVLTYGDMLKGYARVRNLRRVLIPVPVLTPRLSAHWVHWMTPVHANIVYSFIEGLRNEVVVRDDTARALFPDIDPVDYETAVRRALASLEAGQVETSWCDSLSSCRRDTPPVELTTEQGMQIERRQQIVDASPEDVYAVFSRLGGDEGWLYADTLWWLRGVADRLVGGPGFRRGRRDPEKVRVGDAIDFWRVEAVEPDRMLRLRAEMKVPGDAWLQLEAKPLGEGRTLLVQTAYLAPRGLFGFLYWYSLYPIHGLMFGEMISRMAARAEARSASQGLTSTARA
ncbi:MAG: SDR family oxidoreductase [Anaerolineae bacterium]|jgi:uncharacterized protein YbjT (DUF2867 family)